MKIFSLSTENAIRVRKKIHLFRKTKRFLHLHIVLLECCRIFGAVFAYIRATDIVISISCM